MSHESGAYIARRNCNVKKLLLLLNERVWQKFYLDAMLLQHAGA